MNNDHALELFPLRVIRDLSPMVKLRAEGYGLRGLPAMDEPPRDRTRLDRGAAAATSEAES